MSVPVSVNGKTVPYILTINGVTLTQVDIEMAVRLIAEDYQSNEVVLPDLKAHPHLVNSASARTGMTMARREAVKVIFPDGWSTVDAYMKDHYVSGYTNYYRGPDIEDAYLSTLPSKEPRFLEEPAVEQGEAPNYKEVKDLLEIPLIQRGILGVQALNESEQKDKSDGQEWIKPEEIGTILNLTQNQIQAARPLTELSSTRTLSLSEYRLAEKELGLNLQNLLEFEIAARAATLRALYREEPKLFTEHKVRNNPKAINALIDAYGSSFPEEIRAILKLNDLSDGQALRLLEGLKAALTEGDLEKSKSFQKQLEGTKLESWAKDAVPLAFIRMNTADTALGRKLVSGLSTSDNAFILSALSQPPPRESQLLKAFQEIARTMEIQNLSYDQARDRWLSDGNVSVKTKARFLGMSLVSPQASEKKQPNEFNLLFSQIPDAQKKDVEDAIDEFSSFRIFASIHRKTEPREVEESRPSILQRLLGRVVRQFQHEAVAALPDNLKVESFEFISAPIPLGGVKFMMGSPPNETWRYDNETQREVTLTKPFQFGTTTVTQWQWEAIMGKNPSRFKEGVESLNRPVGTVSWKDAQIQIFIQKLNQRDPKWDYRLPTEAEWEFMTRAGTTTSYSHGNDIADLELYSYFSQNSGEKTHPVAEKRPNPWGIYDAHGNVWEWVEDGYSAKLAGGVDPLAPYTPGSYRVLRGGSCCHDVQDLRSALRFHVHPEFRYDDIGFRLVRTPKVLP